MRPALSLAAGRPKAETDSSICSAVSTHHINDLLARRTTNYKVFSHNGAGASATLPTRRRVGRSGTRAPAPYPSGVPMVTMDPIRVTGSERDQRA
jgi:hypothetical protein